MFDASPKLKHLLVTGALVASTWVGTAVAQSATNPATGQSATNPGTGQSATNPSEAAPPTTPETDTMEHYLTNHPRVADELHNDPSLINNPQWLSQHPEVKNWMNNHPNVKADAALNPKNIVNNTERETLNNDRHAMNNTDSFLAQHPGMAKQLNADPNLIDNPKYLAQHPALQNYLNQHPGIANEWKDHPKAFADAARADERYNKTGQVPPVAGARPAAKK
jgi:hypothetical protein